MRDPLYRSPEYLDLIGRVATNVRNLRQGHGWTQEEAATRCGQLSVYVLRQIESAQTNVTAVTLARLSAGFGVDVATFLVPAPTPTRRTPGRPALIPQVVAPGPLPRRQNGSAEERTTGDTSTAQSDPTARIGSVETQPASSTVPVHVGTSTRLVATDVVVPTYPSAQTQTFTLPELRDFIATVLAANPAGLTASELLHVARSAGQERLVANSLHYALHHLVRSGYVQRTGARGSYLHRWLGGKTSAVSDRQPLQD